MYYLYFFLRVHTEFANQTVVIWIVPSVIFLYSFGFWMQVIVAVFFLLLWHVIFIIVTSNSELIYYGHELNTVVPWLLIMLIICVMMLTFSHENEAEYGVDNLFIIVHLHFMCIWSWSQLYGGDCIDTHHALPEEGCDVK